jgi:hypothetical protein
LKQELQVAVTKQFLLGLQKAQDTDTVISECQVLVDKITELTGYYPQTPDKDAYGMPQDTDDERLAQMPFDVKIGSKVDELKRKIVKRNETVQSKIDGLKQRKQKIEQDIKELGEFAGDDTLTLASQ